jgi:hypothetical protein
MKRAPKAELTRRINRAFTLLSQGLTQDQVIKELITEHSVSNTQAYRYVQQAIQNGKSVPIPESKEVFTVKLAPSLIDQIRSFAHIRNISISGIVSLALEDFLKRKKNGPQKRRQGG